MNVVVNGFCAGLCLAYPSLALGSNLDKPNFDFFSWQIKDSMYHIAYSSVLNNRHLLIIIRGEIKSMYGPQ